MSTNHSGVSKVISISRKRRQATALIEDARAVFDMQARAITGLSKRINGEYQKAIKTLLNTNGHTIICGMGKSGLVGKKIAATFASTGTPSFFLHPAEAFHGDLGMVTPEDTVIMISNSGETEEIVRLLPFMKQSGIPIISLVGRTNSTLAAHSAAVLDISVDGEACPNNLAPTNSTLATMAMGDALAVSLIKERNFQPYDFARFHPGGSLGRQLLTRVRDIMHTGVLPIAHPDMSVQDALMIITEGRLGLTLVMDGDDIAGIVTDGDLRRAMQKHPDLFSLPVRNIMSPTPRTIHENELFSTAEEMMRDNKIKALVVLDDDGKLTGIVEVFDN